MKVSDSQADKLHVLLVEDDLVDQMAFERFVKQENLAYVYQIVNSVAQAQAVLRQAAFDLIISDYSLGDGTALDICAFAGGAPIIVITGAGDEEIAARALRAGVYDYLVKDITCHYLKVLPLTVQKTMQQRRTEDQIRMLSHAMRSISDSVYISDLDQCFIFVNQAFCQTYGYTAEQVLGQSTELLMAAIEATDLELPYFQDNEMLHQRADGRLFPVALSSSRMCNEQGKEIAIVNVVRDISERKQREATIHKLNAELEERVEQRTAALQYSNEELQRFVYAASHDLQEPLRTVSMYVGLLLKRFDTQPDARTQKILDFILKGTERMRDLISDLLAYSQLAQATDLSQQVDCNLCLQAACDSLQARIEESAAEIQAGPLPVVQGNALELTRLFQNLLSNALKFRSSTGQPCIQIHCQRLETDWQIAVIDNGIGVAPQYAEQIFVIFKRLHQREKYPGTGIGLALCKKIVESHGGKIWVESAPGQGAAFYFTLPVA